MTSLKRLGEATDAKHALAQGLKQQTGELHKSSCSSHTARHDQLFADFRRTPLPIAFLRYDALMGSGTDLSVCFADLGALWACSSRLRELAVLIYGRRVASAIETRAAWAEQQA